MPMLSDSQIKKSHLSRSGGDLYKSTRARAIKESNIVNIVRYYVIQRGRNVDKRYYLREKAW